MKIISFIIIFLLSPIVYSNETEPNKFLNDIMEKSKPMLMKKNHEFLEKTMEQYIDFNEIAIWVTGKAAWFNSSIEEQIFFKKELKTLMLKTYSKTVYHYIDANITFIKPKSNTIKAILEKKIQISSIIKKNNKNINISYRLIKNQETWLIFDIIIEGVSILKSLKTQYSDMIKTKGLTHTAKKMKSLNNKYYE